MKTVFYKRNLFFGSLFFLRRALVASQTPVKRHWTLDRRLSLKTKDAIRYIFIEQPQILLNSSLRFIGYPLYHSHSIVAGGFELISYATRFTPSTSFKMRDEIFAKTS